MVKDTALSSFLRSGRHDEARQLLEVHLASGQLLDPRHDDAWKTWADRIERAIETARGLDAALEFWEGLERFFVERIEPEWGRAHKGHIYFRLGIGYLRMDLTRGTRQLEKAYEEDRALEQTRGGTLEEVEERLKRYSAHVALALVERIKDEEFTSPQERQRFLGDLFAAFDAAMVQGTVRADLIDTALVAIVPAKALIDCRARYEELRHVVAGGLPFATVAATGTVLESILLADLLHRRGLTREDLERCTLGPLLNLARCHSTFPGQKVAATCRLVNIFRNRLHPANEMWQTYKLTRRVATTVYLLFEVALLDWGRALTPLQDAPRSPS